ncbi:hypothetical protein ACVNP0_01640 [Staphylococcus aureus]
MALAVSGAIIQRVTRMVLLIRRS